MRTRYVIIMVLFCAILTVSSIQNTSAERVELKFDDTHSGPYLDEVVYKIIAGKDYRVLALLTDEIDILDGIVSFYDLAPLEADPDIEITSILRNGYGHITINCRDAPLNWTVLRRAFALAYNKTRVQTEILEGRSQLQDSLVPYANSLFCIENGLPYDYYDSVVTLGNALLDAAGFDINGVTGFREDPNGNPIHINIAYSPLSPMIAGGCAQEGVDALTSLHISAETNAEDFNTYMSNMYAHGSYDMVVLTTDFDNNDVDWLAYEYWSENADEPYQNPSNFINDTYDSCRDQLISGTTFDDVYNASCWMQKILHYNVPVLVVYEDMRYSAYRTDRFNGFVVDQNKNIGNEWTNVKAHLNLSDGGPFSGSLRVSMEQEPDSFNPMTSSSPYSKEIFNNIFSTLLRTGPDGQRRLDLAESYIMETHDSNPAVPEGHTRFTFDIIQNASWSDGTPLTAYDIAYTFSYHLSSAVYGNPTALSFQDLVTAIAPTPSRVVLEFSTESYWLLSKISDVIILQRTLLESIGYSGWDSWNPVFSDPLPTSGPFNLTRYETGEYVELTYHSNYHYGIRGTGSDVPVIEEQADFDVVESPYMELSWNVIDDNPLFYKIYCNNTLLEHSYYDQSPISVSLDGYDLGPYTFKLEVYDFDYQNATDTVTITIIPDTFAPEISGSALVELVEGSTDGVEINWTVFDDNPSNYTIYKDGTEVLSETWNWGTEQIFYTLGDLSVANYSYTLTVRDTLGHSSSWSILVSVKERPPTLGFDSLILIGAGAAVVVVVISIIALKKQR